MRALIVGGTGLVGGWVAVDLVRQRIDATIMARRPPALGSPMAKLPYLQGDYFSGDLDPKVFRGFDTLLFAACSDIRHYVPAEHASLDAFYRTANVEGVPRFMRRAYEGGIKRVVYIGTLYASLKPASLTPNSYVDSRLAVDRTLRNMASTDFHVQTLDIPYVLGGMRGLVPSTFRAVAEWALGRRPDVPLVSPAGGSNFMSLTSVTEAIQGAMEGIGENGSTHLLGDENLSFRELCRMFFRAAKRDEELPETQDEHPLLPDMMLPAGRGNWLRFNADAEARLFRYGRNDVERAVRDLVSEVLRSANDGGSQS